MLRPWLDYPPDFEPDPDPDSYFDRRVFQLQLVSWNSFRRWQAHNRREGCPRYVKVDYEFGALDQAYNIFVWDFRRATPTYTDAVRNLLAQYGFTQPFQFHEDPTQQDKLTTWIEYLGCETSMHYRYNRLVKKMQPDYDEDWKKLVDSNVLGDLETEEYINNVGSAVRRQNEREQASVAASAAAQDAAAATKRYKESSKNARRPVQHFWRE